MIKVITGEDCNNDPKWKLMQAIRKITDWWVAPFGAGENLARAEPAIEQIKKILFPGKETSISIALWAEETFGPATAFSTVIRAQKEMNELIELLADNSPHMKALLAVQHCITQHMENHAAQTKKNLPSGLGDELKVMTEVADVVIVLARIQRFLQASCLMEEAVDFKMDINRKRVWKLDGNGHGQHVDKTSEECQHGVHDWRSCEICNPGPGYIEKPVFS